VKEYSYFHKLIVVFILGYCCACSSPNPDSTTSPVSSQEIPGESAAVVSESFEGKNIVLITIDGLRPDVMGVYGHAPSATPHIDALASNSVVFDRAYATSSFIGQSLSSLMTGRLPSAGGTTGLLEAHPRDETRTLAQEFGKAGYYTGIVTNQPRVRGKGLTKGFEDVQIGPSKNRWSGKEVVRRSLSFVDDAAEDPFMLFVHFGDIQQWLHDSAKDTVGLAPDALTKEYRTIVTALDFSIEKLIKSLASDGHPEDTVIVFTASQGVELGEHGFVGDGWVLYEESVNVPLFIHAPGMTEIQRLREAVSLVNVAPTLLSSFGLGTFGHTTEGETLTKAVGDTLEWKPPSKPQVAELIIPERCMVRAVWSGSRKYIATISNHPVEDRPYIHQSFPQITLAMSKGEEPIPELWELPSKEELFNLSADPDEKEDRSGSAVEELDFMRGQLEEYRLHCVKHGLESRRYDVHDAPELENIEDLESLGYL